MYIMGKFIKLIVSLSIVLSLMSISTFAHAEEQSGNLEFLTVDRYKELQKEGILGEDVTYELAQKLFEAPQESEELGILDNLEELGILDNLEEVPVEDTNVMAAAASYRPGDIFISSKPGGGMVSWVHGHAGIIGSDGQIIHMIQSGVKKESVGNFLKHNKGTNAFRVPNSTVARNAGSWASNYYNNWKGKAKYQINTAKYTQNEMYCSKLVWQAYWFGTGSAPVLKNPTFAILHPYGLTTQFNLSYQPKAI